MDKSFQNLFLKLKTTAHRFQPTWTKLRWPVWWAMALGITVGIYLIPTVGFDWFIFYQPQGQHYRPDLLINPMWTYFLIAPLTWLPGRLSLLAMGLLNVGVIYAISRISKVNPFGLLLSFPFFWMIWFGQYDAIVAFGALLGYLALQKKRPYLLGLAVMVLLIKPHIGGFLALVYLVWAKDWRPFVSMLAVYLLSNLVWGWDWSILWVQKLIQKQIEPYYVTQKINISLFPYGLVFLLAVFVPMERIKKIQVAQAATCLATTYSPAYSLMFLFAFPLPWWGYVLATLPVVLLGHEGYVLTTLLPLGLILMNVIPWLQNKIKSSRLSTRKDNSIAHNQPQPFANAGQEDKDNTTS